MVKMRRPSGVLGNFLVNTGGKAVQLAIALATVPLFIHHIGTARYGVLSIVWILLGYFGFLDLGLSRASANALGRLRFASRPERARVLTTALYLNIALGLLGSVAVFLVGGAVMDHYMDLDPTLRAEVVAAFPWIVFMLPLGMVSGIFIGALESREHFFSANLLQIVGYVLSQAIPVGCAILIGPSLALLIPAVFIGRLASLLLTVLVVLRVEGVIDLRAFDRTQVRALFDYGGWVTVTNLLSPILDFGDQMMITALLGPSTTTYYAVPMNLGARVQFIPGALARTLFPRLSLLNGPEAASLSARATVVTAYGFCAFCAPAILLIGFFLQIWIGADFATQSRAVGELLMIGVWLNGVAFIPFSLLQGQGRPAAVAKLHAAELPPFFAFLWLLTSTYGLIGAGLAWTVRVGVDGIALLILARTMARDMLRLAPPFVILLAAYGFAGLVQPGPLVSLLAGFAAVAVLAGIGLLLEPELRAVAQRVLVRLPLPAIARRMPRG